MVTSSENHHYNECKPGLKIMNSWITCNLKTDFIKDFKYQKFMHSTSCCNNYHKTELFFCEDL